MNQKALVQRRFCLLLIISNLDETEFLDKVSSFKSFNEFFYRKLKPESRPINRESGSVVFPADGRHLGVENISSSSRVYAKGQFFNLEKLLNSADLSKKYANGDLIISRLCPTDYHRFHFQFQENCLKFNWLMVT